MPNARAASSFRLVLLALTLVFGSLLSIGAAQAARVEPLSRDSRLSLVPLDEVALKVMDPIDVEALLAEDRANANDFEKKRRVGLPMAALTEPPRRQNLSPANSGTWEELSGGGQENSDAPHFDLQIDPSYPCDAAGQSIPLTLKLFSAGFQRPEVLEFEMPLGAPVPFGLFDDNLEPAPQPGWVFFALTAPWTLKNSADPQHHTSPTHSWFVPNWEFAAQSKLRTPAFTELPANSRLRFQHRFKTENSTDGGVLEYSLDGGLNWYDINHDLASGEQKNRFLANGYTGSIAALSNRAAWEDDSGGWLQVEVDLSDFAGQTLDLRFLLATNQGNVAAELEGWYIDDVIVERIEYDCSPLAQPPGTIRDLRLGRTPSGEITLDWEPPSVTQGGAIMTYLLQETPLGPLSFSFVVELGSSTHAKLNGSLLNDGSGFLVVGANSLGLGSTGSDSDGLARPPAQPAP